jgi:hypothetical protein
MNDKYEFDEKAHKHTLNGEALAGVTTVLKVVNPVNFDEEGNVSSKTDMLMSWAVKMDIEEATKVDWKSLSKKEFEAELKRCKGMHRSSRDAAGLNGKAVHKSIENFLAGNYDLVPENHNIVVKFVNDWIEKEKIEIVYSEKNVYSKKLKVGGILDMLIKKDGKYYIADIKTSKNIYEENFWQMSAYGIMLKELENIDVSGYYVIHLPATGENKIEYRENTGMQERAFLSALEIYRISLNQRR